MGDLIANQQPHPVARLVRTVGAVLIVLGILGGTLAYLSGLKTGPELICANRADSIPAAIEGKPSLSLADARLAAMPTRLTCTWSVDGKPVVTDAYIAPQGDLATGALLVFGVGAIIGSAAFTARARAKAPAPR